AGTERVTRGYRLAARSGGWSRGRPGCWLAWRRGRQASRRAGRWRGEPTLAAGAARTGPAPGPACRAAAPAVEAGVVEVSRSVLGTLLGAASPRGAIDGLQNGHRLPAFLR